MHKNNQNVRGRSQDIIFDTHTTLEYTLTLLGKISAMKHLLIDMLQDQWNWIKDRNHKRVIDECNASSFIKNGEKWPMRLQKIINPRNEESYISYHAYIEINKPA